MSGSMSREWKRTVWQAPQARRTTPRHFLTLPTTEVGGCAPASDTTGGGYLFYRAEADHARDLQFGNYCRSHSLVSREEIFMASNPEIPPPDTINPQSPAEIPGETAPAETPFGQPAEIVPDTPNVDEPDRAPSELPPPLD